MRGIRLGLIAAGFAAMALAVLGGSAAGPLSARHAEWKEVGPGLELGTVQVAAPGEGRWTRLMLLRLDPARVRLGLSLKLNRELSAGAWTVEDAPSGAIAAFNAGQFNSIAPWGWTVMDGVELRPPGTGPLSMAVVADRAGRIRFVEPDSIELVRSSGTAWTVIQSYPSLLTCRGEVPAAFVTPGSGVNIAHRDARLALAELADGRILLLLTRFDGLGTPGGSIPLGLTLAETADLLRSLGAVRAVALDGGISSQLMVRADGGVRIWPGWRKVPLGIVVSER